MTETQAKYQEVAGCLRNEIRHGGYTVGQQLPLEKELCEMYGVSRTTVKRAVDVLVAEGFVVKRRGAGTFVKALDRGIVQHLNQEKQFGGFTEYYAGYDIGTKVLHYAVVHPTEEVARLLMIEPDDFVYDISRLRLVSGKPIVVEYTQMPLKRIPELPKDVLNHSIYRYLENELGLRIQSAHRRLRAVMPTGEEKELLGIEGRLPLLEVTQTAFLADGLPFEYSISRHRGDKMVYRVVSIR